MSQNWIELSKVFIKYEILYVLQQPPPPFVFFFYRYRDKPNSQKQENFELHRVVMFLLQAFQQYLIYLNPR